MGNDDHNPIVFDFLKMNQERGYTAGAERVRRLVEDHDAHGFDQRPAERNFLFFAAGKVGVLSLNQRIRPHGPVLEGGSEFGLEGDSV